MSEPETRAVCVCEAAGVSRSMQTGWACWAAPYGERSGYDHAYPVLYHRVHSIRGDEWTCGEHARSHSPGSAMLRLVSVACCGEGQDGCGSTPFPDAAKCSFAPWSATEEQAARKSAVERYTPPEEAEELQRWIATVDQARRERDQAREELEKLRAAVREHRTRVIHLLLRSDMVPDDHPAAQALSRATDALWGLVP